VSPAILELLACPRCDDRPALREEGQSLVCTSCGWRYRVEDGIPILLASEAEPPEGE
jgi:hypothetical protein